MKSKNTLLIVLFILCLSSCSSYKKADITFNNEAISLSGTLYLPEGEGPFPAVVFVHGSGEETRKNSTYSAKWMTSLGYAALVYDKRGTGESDGNEKDWSYFSFDDLAGDVVAAIQLLERHENIDPNKIGLHASSQGGWVAALAASKTESINFMIIKSPSVSTVSEDRIFERSARLKREGFSDSDIEEAVQMQRVEGKTTEGNDTPDTFTDLFEQNKNKAWFARVYPGTSPFTQSLVTYRTWYSTIMNFDPVTHLNKLDIPVIWLFGDSELDQLGPVDQSIATLNQLKEKGKAYKVIQYSGESHNISEKAYEQDVYNWLKTIYPDQTLEFRKH